jgi:hypothetical protein
MAASAEGDNKTGRPIGVRAGRPAGVFDSHVWFGKFHQFCYPKGTWTPVRSEPYRPVPLERRDLIGAHGRRDAVEFARGAGLHGGTQDPGQGKGDERLAGEQVTGSSGHAV